MRGRLQRAIEAYRDGALTPRKRRKIEGILSRDAEAQRHLQESRALGRLIRQAWNEGPTSPPPERFLAAIRADLQRIDAERARRRQPVRRAPLRPAWVRSLAYLAPAAAAAALLVALGDVRELAPGIETETAGLSMERLDWRSDSDFMHVLESRPMLDEYDDSLVSSRTAIYDVYQGDADLLIYDAQDESPVLIFALPDEIDDLSVAPPGSSMGGFSLVGASR